MKETKIFSEKHNGANIALAKALSRLKERKEVTNVAIDVGKELGVTHTTIINYLQGRGKDGYLKEAILNQLKTKI
jgi:predicted transcriptional regulator